MGITMREIRKERYINKNNIMRSEKMTGIKTLVCLLAVVMFSASLVVALPPRACDFVGTVTINGVDAPIGTLIVAEDPDGIQFENVVNIMEGMYGFLTVAGDDPETLEDEGAEEGDTIIFFVNGIQAVETGIWSEGATQNVNLSICEEDWTCTEWSECYPNGTQTRTCTDQNECGTEENKPAETQDCEYEEPYRGSSGSAGITCTSEWECGEWSECYPNGTQTRTCTDSHNCKVPTNKPEETQACTYTAPATPATPTCVEDWTCTNWLECQPGGTQTRICMDNNVSGTEENKPAETQSCEYTPPEYCGDEICQADEDCSTCEADCGVCPPTPPTGYAILTNPPILASIIGGGMLAVLGLLWWYKKKLGLKKPL